jgi:ABC-type polysaccharide/polyol phosphate export permease
MNNENNPQPKTARQPIFEFDASQSGFPYAIRDLQYGISKPRLMVTLIRNAFMARYPSVYQAIFWICLTTFMIAVGMGLIYGQIFSEDRSQYMPYVASGIIIWAVIASLLNDGSSAFVNAASVFEQSSIPKSLFAIQTIGVITVTFSIKFVALIIVLAVVNMLPSWSSILVAMAGTALLLWTGFWFTLALGTMGLRFRDIPLLTNAIVTISFFVTPVFWHVERLGEYQEYIVFNPLYHFLHIVRGPLLGHEGVGESFIWAAGYSLFVAFLGMLVYGQFARRISYWR